MIRTILLFVALTFAGPALAIDFPPLSGRVVDQADLLTPEQEAMLTQRLEALEQATSRQLVVATISSLQDQPIEDYGYQLGRRWGLGAREANNGIILLIAPNERKMRIEVGYGLEGVMTDALSSQIIRDAITPRFRADPPDYAGGIIAGADAIIAQLQAPPEAAEQRVLAAQQAENRRGERRSRGGGAIVPLIIWGAVLVFFLLPMLGAGLAGRRYRKGVSIWGPGHRRGGSGLGWMLAGMALGSISRGGRGGGGSWGGGGSSWGGGGGGFSGGGGSFGGGGASGGMVMAYLSEADHALVTAAVATAERESDGEIVTIVAQRSDAYHDVALHYAVLAMLLVPTLGMLVPQGWIDWGTGLLFGWNAEIPFRLMMALLFVKMAGLFLIVRYLLAWQKLRLALTPGRTKSRRVHRRAVELFRTGCELKTRGRTGVLLYLSLAERRAEIVADKAIADQVTGDVWGEAMAVLVDEVKAGRPGQGMALAVERIGAVLAPILPPTHDNPDELPNRLLEL